MPTIDTDTFKLWHQRRYVNKTWVEHADELVISAHGEQTRDRSEFNHEGQDLRFYAPEGSVLLSPKINVFLKDLAAGEVVAKETRTLSSPNYKLTKFQGYHGTPAGAFLGGIVKPFIKTSERLEDYGTVEGALLPQRDGRSFDILTIRYRPGSRGSATLSSVLEALKGMPQKYAVIHCAFCRNSFSFNPKTFNPYTREESRYF